MENCKQRRLVCYSMTVAQNNKNASTGIPG